MPLSEEHKLKMAAGRERRRQEIEAGIRPAPLRRKRRTRVEMQQQAAPAAPDDDTAWMKDVEHEITAPPSFTETPAFQAAVAAAVAAALETKTQEIIGRLTAQRTVLGTAPESSDSGFARTLAAQLAQLIDGDRRRSGQAARLSAEEIESRAAGQERMERLLLEAYSGDKGPTYNVMKPLYFEEQLVEPTWQNPATKVLMRRQIVWYGVPNEHMAPADAVAVGIHDAMLQSIGGVTAAINRPDLGRPKLKIVGSSDVEGAPAVGKPKNIGMLKLLGDTVAGQITETNVLGSIAAPARQLA